MVIDFFNKHWIFVNFTKYLLYYRIHFQNKVIDFRATYFNFWLSKNGFWIHNVRLKSNFFEIKRQFKTRF